MYVITDNDSELSWKVVSYFRTWQEHQRHAGILEKQTSPSLGEKGK